MFKLKKKKLLFSVLYLISFVFLINLSLTLFISNIANPVFTNYFDFGALAYNIMLFELFFVLMIALIYTGKEHIKKLDLVIILSISIVSAFIATFFQNVSISQSIYVTIFLAIFTIGYVFYNDLIKKEKIVYFFEIFFYFFIFSATLVLLVYFTNSNSDFDPSSQISNTIKESNYLIVDILNEHSTQILYPHINFTYDLAYSNGFLKNCELNNQINCSIHKDKNEFVDFENTYFTNTKLFEKDDYVEDFEDSFSEFYSQSFFNTLFYILVFTFSLFFMSLFSLIIFLINFILAKILKLLSWIADPLGIEKFK